MAIRINVPFDGRKSQVETQLRLIYILICCNSRPMKDNKEIKALAYMCRHNTAGIFVSKKNFGRDIAKAIGSTKISVGHILRSLRRKGLIKFVANDLSNGLGVYTFHPAVQAICKYDNVLEFNFVMR